jgi:hypothetical protein
MFGDSITGGLDPVPGRLDIPRQPGSSISRQQAQQQQQTDNTEQHDPIFSG